MARVWTLTLQDEGDFRSIALAKMEGYTNEEIARQIRRSIPTVERKLALIRKTWKSHSRSLSLVPCGTAPQI